MAENGKQRKGPFWHWTGAGGPAGDVNITADEARALIDQVIRSYGLDPQRVTDTYGWRRIGLGGEQGAIGVVRWNKNSHYLTLFAPLARLPAPEKLPADVLLDLLRLNHGEVGAARFSVDGNTVFLTLVRPIRGLDRVEVDDALRNVLVVAERYGEILRAVLETAERDAPLAVEELPRISLKPREMQVVSAVLAGCDDHGRDIFRYLLERWQGSGYLVDPGTTGIGLKIELAGRSYGIGALRPGLGERLPLLILGWESLRRLGIFPDGDIDRFQEEVARLNAPAITESSAHIEVNELFEREAARKLLGALQKLIATAHPPAQVEQTPWPTAIPQPDIKVGAKSRDRILETLQACDGESQAIFNLLMEGWQAAGGVIHCNKTGRIYLRLTTPAAAGGDGREHTYNLAVLAAPGKKRGAAIEPDVDDTYLSAVPALAARFAAAVTALPGYQQDKSVHRLALDEGFGSAEARRLLASMRALKTDLDKLAGAG